MSVLLLALSHAIISTPFLKLPDGQLMYCILHQKSSQKTKLMSFYLLYTFMLTDECQSCFLCVCKHDSVSSNTYWIICDDVLWIYSEHVIASLSYLLQMDVEFLVSMRCNTFLSRQFIHATWSRASMDLND